MSLIELEYEKNIPPFSQQFILSTDQKLKKFLFTSKLRLNLLSVLFCDDHTIQKLNLQFRNIDQPTDVLSWSNFNENCEREAYIPDGYIAISYPICLQRAEQYQFESYHTEFIRLLVHGIVHILGYDHQTSEEEEAMLLIEKNILQYFQLNNLY